MIGNAELEDQVGRGFAVLEILDLGALGGLSLALLGPRSVQGVILNTQSFLVCILGLQTKDVECRI